MACKARTVSYSLLYGGKMAAALSRQHPRDLFDCKYMGKKVTTLKQSRYFFVEIRTPGERSALLFLVLVFLFQGIETIHLLKHGGRDVERRIGVEQGIGIDDEFVTTIGIEVLDGAVQQVLSPVREDEILFVERFGFLLCRSLVRS